MAETDRRSGENYIAGVRFVPGKMDDNCKKLMSQYGLTGKLEVAKLVNGFIVYNPEGTRIDLADEQGVYELTLLVHALSDAHNGENRFQLTPSNKALIGNYMPTNVVTDARENEGTAYATLRYLLADGDVQVSVMRLS
jgi:hypothetical protein